MRCKLCWSNEATVRDRNTPTDKRKTICSECHKRRLAHDIAYIVRYKKSRGIE